MQRHDTIEFKCGRLAKVLSGREEAMKYLEVNHLNKGTISDQRAARILIEHLKDPYLTIKITRLVEKIERQNKNKK